MYFNYSIPHILGKAEWEFNVIWLCLMRNVHNDVTPKKGREESAKSKA